jgi:hypothetical protein
MFNAFSSLFSLSITESLSIDIPSSYSFSSGVPKYLRDIVDQATIRYQNFTSTLSTPQHRKVCMSENSESNSQLLNPQNVPHAISNQKSSVLDAQESYTSTNEEPNSSGPNLSTAKLGTNHKLQRENFRDYYVNDSCITGKNRISSVTLDGSPFSVS